MRSVGSRIAAAAVWLVVALVVLHVSAGWGAQAPGDSVAVAAVTAAPASSPTATAAPGGFGSAPVLTQAPAGFHPPASMPGSPSVPAAKSRVADAESLTTSLTLQQAVFDIGEPIVATLTIRNVSTDSVSIETGMDYRSGRPQRFRFRVTNEKGAVVADPLRVYANSGLGGGLGSDRVLGPGETQPVSTLLNLFAAPRTPGRYTVAGDYEVLSKKNDREPLQVVWPVVTFEVRNRASRMSQKEGSALLAKHDLADTHPCILYGLQNDTSRIPELLAMAQAQPPQQAPGKLEPTLAERNAAPGAMEALVLIADKKAVYGALETEIAKQYPEPDKGESLHGPLAGLYRMVITPEVLPLLDKSMDHANVAVAQQAFRTALSLGSAKGLERLPEALRSGDDALRVSAMEGADLFMMRVYGPPDLQMEGLSPELAERYDDALLDGFRQEERRDPADPARPEAWVSRYLTSFHFNSRHLWDAIQIAVQSDSELKHRAILGYLVSYGPGLSSPSPWNPALDTRVADRENLASLIPFARRQMRTSADPVTRALAMRFLGLWGDTESVPALAAALDGADPQQRMAAAQALILLHHEPLLEKSIGRLVDDDDDMRPGQVTWLARRLGMKDYMSLQMFEGEKGVPRANMNPALRRAEPIPRTIEEMRDYRKTVLRRLAGVKDAAGAGPSPAAASGDTTH